MYYIYLIKNTRSDSTYIGYTNGLKRRLAEHNTKQAELVYYETYKAKQDAQERERKLKQQGQGCSLVKKSPKAQSSIII